MQGWVDKYFPTREFFAPLAAYLLRIAPQYEAPIKEFRQRRFGIYTIGIQIRRRKCDNNREDLHCEGRPTIQARPWEHDSVPKTVAVEVGILALPFRGSVSPTQALLF